MTDDGDFIGYGASLLDPKWPGGARIVVNINLNFEGGKRSVTDGDGGSEGLLSDIGMPSLPSVRSPTVESVFKYGGPPIRDDLARLDGGYKGEPSSSPRKDGLRAIEQLAGHNLHAWEQVGPGIQMTLTSLIEGLGPAGRAGLCPILIPVWGSFLMPNCAAVHFPQMLSATLRHDLRTPLSAIEALARLARASPSRLL
jgi:hypothetical protein